MVALPENINNNSLEHCLLRSNTLNYRKNADWPKTDIDRFILAKLEASGLEPPNEIGRAHV